MNTELEKLTEAHGNTLHYIGIITAEREYQDLVHHCFMQIYGTNIFPYVCLPWTHATDLSNKHL